MHTNRSLVLVTLMIGTSMAAIDSSIVNVSLPVIQREFDVPMDAVALIVSYSDLLHDHLHPVHSSYQLA